LMRERKLPDGWRWVKFGDIVRQVKDRVDPETAGLDRYVAGEHMDTDDLRIRRWGTVGDGYLGPAFHMRFKPSHVLYGSRRTYLRKVAVADFEGITANTTFVIEPATDELLAEFLPLVMTTEVFHDHSVKQSKGSVNPYINFRDIAWYEFALPPVGEQKALVTDFDAIDDGIDRLTCVARAATTLRESLTEAVFDEGSVAALVHLTDLVRRPIQYGVLKPGPEFAGGVPCVDVKDYPDGRLHPKSVRRIDPAIDALFTRSRLAEDDLLVSIRGTIGRVTRVPPELDGANISRDSARISLSDLVDPSYVRLMLESAHAQREMRGKVVGLAVKGINIADLRRVTVPLPPLAEQRQVAARCEAVRAVASDAMQTAARLRLVRRAFLFRLVSGETHVR
jgi:type I restriction enzyme, S subunit